MAKDEVKSKWAVEAHEFLKLFARYALTPVGLLLALVGWTLLLVLVAKLSKQGETPTMTLPLRPLSDVSNDIQLPLTSVFSIGSIVILVFWIMASRTFLYVYCPLKRILRNVRLLVLHVALVFFNILHAPLFYILLRPLEKRKIAKWRASQDPEKVAAIIKEHGQHGEEALNQRARKETGFNAEWLSDKVTDIWANQVIALASAGYIGLAPFKTYSFAESQKASKAPNQMFATAISWLRSELGTLYMTRYSQFVTLPEYPQIGTEDQAKRIRRCLFFDALMWGSFVSVQPAKVWLNIDTRLSKPVSDDRNGTSYLDVDPSRPIQPRTLAMIIDPDDPSDLYVALLCVLREAVDARKIHRFRLYPRAADRFALSRSEQNAIIVSLLKNVLFNLKDAAPSGVDMVPSAKSMLVRLASDWAASNLEEGTAYGQPCRWEENRETLHKCIQLDTACPEHYYRLGAVSLLLDQESEAFTAFSKAQSMERGSLWRDPVQILSVTKMYLKLLRYETARFHAVAHAAACVARSVAALGETVIPQLRSAFEQSNLWELRFGMGEEHARDVPVALRALLQLLCLPCENQKGENAHGPQ